VPTMGRFITNACADVDRRCFDLLLDSRAAGERAGRCVQRAYGVRASAEVSRSTIVLTLQTIHLVTGKRPGFARVHFRGGGGGVKRRPVYLIHVGSTGSVRILIKIRRVERFQATARSHFQKVPLVRHAPRATHEPRSKNAVRNHRSQRIHRMPPRQAPGRRRPPGARHRARHCQGR